MSKISINLSYKNICILKHSLRNRIENDTPNYNLLQNLSENEIGEKGKQFIKEHDEHRRCFNALENELERAGYMHGINIFIKGDK